MDLDETTETAADTSVVEVRKLGLTTTRSELNLYFFYKKMCSIAHTLLLGSNDHRLLKMNSGKKNNNNKKIN